MRQLFADAGQPLTETALVAVGHRVVHGGAVFGDPIVVDQAVLQQIRDLSVLAPLHNPANATGIERAMTAFPGIPQVAVFDTAFFRDLPAVAATYAIDRAVAKEHQIRRYGFHGTSHQYVSGQVPELLGRDPAELKQIVLHLGNGASASAVRGGRAVETSMGLTPLEGLVMGTRSGDVDPGVVFHLLRNGGMDADQVDTLLNRRSGVFGLSGVSDFRDLHKLIASGPSEAADDAALALDVYCHRVRKYVGAYHAVLGGADVIVFTAGVGENDAVVRARILHDLEALGISVDPDAQRGEIVGAQGDLAGRLGGDGDGGADQRGTGHRQGHRRPGRLTAALRGACRPGGAHHHRRGGAGRLPAGPHVAAAGVHPASAVHAGVLRGDPGVAAADTGRCPHPGGGVPRTGGDLPGHHRRRRDLRAGGPAVVETTRRHGGDRSAGVVLRQRRQPRDPVGGVRFR